MHNKVGEVVTGRVDDHAVSRIWGYIQVLLPGLNCKLHLQEETIKMSPFNLVATNKSILTVDCTHQFNRVQICSFLTSWKKMHLIVLSLLSCYLVNVIKASQVQVGIVLMNCTELFKFY